MADDADFSLLHGVVGRYELRAPLGAGGFGEIYRAWDRLDDQEVAVKILRVPDHLSVPARELFVGKFQEEAKLTRKVFRGRTHVRQVFDMGLHVLPDGTSRPWMAMELLEGETLEEHLDRRRMVRAAPRSEAEALAWIRPVLEELAFAHEHGVVHRDIKPANIFLARAPGSDDVVLKVLDFGIAKLLESEDDSTTGNTMTASAVRVFSPHYGAPEQFAGKKTGKYTDVFALGLLLTEVLSDRLPLGPGERVENMQASLDKRERPTPKTRGREVTPALEATILRSVAVTVTERQPDARTLLRELDTSLPARETSLQDVAPTQGRRTEYVTPLASTGTEIAPTEIAPPLQPRAAVTEPMTVTEIAVPEAADPAPAAAPQPRPPSRRTNGMVLLGLGGVVLVGVGGILYGACPPSQTLTEPAKEEATKGELAGGGSDKPEVPPAPAPPLDGKLEIKDTVVGKGPAAKAGDTVRVHYTGRLTNGTEFDASKKHGDKPFEFPLGAGRVIKGWDQGVAGMKVGGKRTLTIPPSLGYGAHGAGDAVPPNATLIFDVELVEIVKK